VAWISGHRPEIQKHLCALIVAGKHAPQHIDAQRQSRPQGGVLGVCFQTTDQALESLLKAGRQDRQNLSDSENLPGLP